MHPQDKTGLIKDQGGGGEDSFGGKTTGGKRKSGNRQATEHFCTVPSDLRRTEEHYCGEVTY